MSEPLCVEKLYSTVLRIAAFDPEPYIDFVKILTSGTAWKVTRFYPFAQLEAAVHSQHFDVIVTHNHAEAGHVDFRPRKLKESLGYQCLVVALYRDQRIRKRKIPKRFFDVELVSPFDYEYQVELRYRIALALSERTMKDSRSGDSH